MSSCSKYAEYVQTILVLESKYKLLMDEYKRKCEDEKTLEKEVIFYRKHIATLNKEMKEMMNRDLFI
tara:strand:- start:2141 stop:2341 length:201 start_codon:yes stop_codon:yes gene_type:complete